MLSGARRSAPPTTMMYTVRNRIKRISRWLGIARTSQPRRLISLTYTLIYSARGDLDADIPADIPGNAIRELADRLVKEAERSEALKLEVLRESREEAQNPPRAPVLWTAPCRRRRRGSGAHRASPGSAVVMFWGTASGCCVEEGAREAMLGTGERLW